MTEKRRERGSGRIWLMGRIWWIQYYSRGKQVRESSHSDRESEAKKLLKRRLSEVELRVHRPLRRITYEEIRDAFVADYVTKRRKSLRFREGKPLPLDKVQRLDKFFAGYHVEDIDSDALATFVTKLQATGKKDSTINRSLSALRRMFRLARKQGKLKDVPPFEMLSEPAPRRGFFEREQYDALSRYLPVYLRLPLALGYFTAMRLGEILNLKWDQVDFLDDAIVLLPGETKNDEGRTIPLTPELRVLLEEQHAKRRPECEYVCFRMDRTGHSVKLKGFRKSWYSACVKAGLGRMERVSESEKGKPKKVTYCGAIFHDLRRSGVRNFVRAGVSEKVARDISGHKTRAVFDRYNITSERDLKEAAQKLETYFSKNGADSGQIAVADSPRVSLPN